MKHFKIIELKNECYTMKKRNMFFRYTMFVPNGYCELYDTVDECTTRIHEIYYPDECVIKILK